MLLDIQNKTSKGWRKVKLREWLNFKYGFGLPKKKRQKGDVAVYGSSGVVGWHNEAKVKNSGIIIGRKGNVGAVYFSEKSFYPIDTVYFVDSLKKKGVLKFFYYLLKTINFQKVDINVGVPGLSRETALDLEVLIPENSEEQRRIADILSAFDEKIELNNKINQILEEMAQAIFKRWFIDFKFPSHEKVKMIDSKIGKIPLELEIMNINGVLTVVKGFEPGSSNYSDIYKKGCVQFYRVRDLKNGGSADVYIDAKLASDRLCKPNDVLISLDGTVGKVAIGCNGAYSSGIYKISSNPQYDYIKNSFIYFFLKSFYVQNILERYKRGTTISHASYALDEIWIPTNENLVKSFQKISEPIFEIVLKNIFENQKLSTLRDLLLPKLMSGEIRV